MLWLDVKVKVFWDVIEVSWGVLTMGFGLSCTWEFRFS